MDRAREANDLRRRRQHTIDMLEDFAHTADVIYQSCAGRDKNANFVALTGGVLGVIGGAVTCFTGGLAAPAVLTGLSLASGGSSIVGGYWSMKNGRDRGMSLEQLDKEIRVFLHEDEKEIRDKLQQMIHRRCERDGCALESAQIDCAVDAVVGGIDGAENSHKFLTEMISMVPSVINIISHGGFPILSGVAVVYVRYSIPTIAKPIEKRLGEGVVKEVGEEVAESATKQVALKATEEGTTAVSKQLAKNGAEAGAKTAAKVAGVVAIAFGGITTVWEGYNLYQNYYATKEISEYGRELRKLARKLKRSLQTGSRPFKV